MELAEESWELANSKQLRVYALAPVKKGRELLVVPVEENRKIQELKIHQAALLVEVLTSFLEPLPELAFQQLGASLISMEVDLV